MNAARLPIDVGQSSAVDELAGGCPEVWNILVDGGGANQQRPGALPILKNDGPGCIGAYVFRDRLVYVTADRRLWVVDPATPSARRALSSADTATRLAGSGRPVFVEDDVRLIIAGGGALQQWIPTETLSKRLDTSGLDASLDDPPLATHIAYLNNYIIANDTRNPNQFKWSGQFPNTSGTAGGSDYVPGHDRWPPLNFNTADAQPDAVAGVYANSRELFVFGTRTLQVYGVTSDYLLPFGSAASLAVGTRAPYSPIPLDETLGFFDDKKRLIVSDGRSYDVLSDPIASTLRDLSRTDDGWGFRADIGSYALLVWVFPEAKRAFCFDRNRKQWSEWRGARSGEEWAALDIGAYAYWPALDKHIVGRASDSSLYELTFDSATDVDGSPISMQRTMPFVDHGSLASKGAHRMRWSLRRGEIPFGGSDVFEVTRRDDLGPFEPWTQLPLGDQTDVALVLEEYPGGVYRRRQTRFRYTGTTRMSIAAVEEQMEVLEVAA